LGMYQRIILLFQCRSALRAMAVQVQAGGLQRGSWPCSIGNSRHVGHKIV
jgi:hypothetical protein